MPDQSLPCPVCQYEYTYSNGAVIVCPDCGHEWNPEEAPEVTGPMVKDANGNLLADGDSVVVL